MAMYNEYNDDDIRVVIFIVVPFELKYKQTQTVRKRNFVTAVHVFKENTYISILITKCGHLRLWVEKPYHNLFL